MLHLLKPPKCGRELGYVIGLQRKTLEYSCAFTAYNDVDYGNFVGADFVAWLNSRRFTRDEQDKCVRKFFQDFPRFLNCDPAQKQQVLKDFIHDQSFFRFLDDSTFKFFFSPAKSNVHTEAAKLLVYFYDFLGFAGYPANVMARILGGANGFCKNDIVAGFKEINPSIEYVCPSCDNAFTDSGNGNSEGYTLEHYFPKSLYPSICLHPYNLIPICSKCNKVKGDNDPLAPKDITDTAHPVPYGEVFHPIQRPVLSQAELNFSFIANCETMNFVSRDPAHLYLPSIMAYELLYDIPPRWKVVWKRVDKRVNDSIKNALKIFIRGRQYNEQLFDEVLTYAINDLRDQCGSEYLSYPACRWLEWAKINKFNDLYASFAN
ncbi:MAG: hypothetical protein PHQ40_03050 [Anaerolineaceae bacterium]|nr:hypothetical protein [Anaerolineaceae bacterium]